MEEKFNLFKNPLSSETLTLRRNTLISSSICIFIGYTEELPKSFALFGINFNPSQQNDIGWFIFCFAFYFYFHFVSNASVELAKWIKPILIKKHLRKELLRHPAFDEQDFIDISEPVDDYDLESVKEAAMKEAQWITQRQLSFQYWFIYIKLFFEIVVPFVIGIVGLFLLVRLLIH